MRSYFVGIEETTGKVIGSLFTLPQSSTINVEEIRSASKNEAIKTYSIRNTANIAKAKANLVMAKRR